MFAVFTSDISPIGYGDDGNVRSSEARAVGIGNGALRGKKGLTAPGYLA